METSITITLSLSDLIPLISELLALTLVIFGLIISGSKKNYSSNSITSNTPNFINNGTVLVIIGILFQIFIILQYQNPKKPYFKNNAINKNLLNNNKKNERQNGIRATSRNK